MHTSIQPKRHLLMLLLLCLMPLSALASDSYQLNSLSELLDDTLYYQEYQQRQWSLATDINNNSQILGYLLKDTNQVEALKITFGSNPDYAILHTPDFISLTDGPTQCFWIFCSTMPYGIRITDDNANSAFLNTILGTAVLPGLPLTRYPGDFVESNDNGVVATTQVNADGSQFGAVIFSSGGSTNVITVNHVPWLIDINDNASPLVIGYNSNQIDTNCLIYGNCPPPEDIWQCENHTHGGALEVGHTHGSAHSPWHCHGRRHENRDERRFTRLENEADQVLGNTAPINEGEAVALLFSNATLSAELRFPSTVEHVSGTASNLFPLAMNNNSIVLRGNVVIGNDQYSNRLLRCVYDADLPDANSDNVIDCEGGLTTLEPLDTGSEINTVIGFSLNENNLLLGNFGHVNNTVGVPFLMNLDTDSHADLLVNHLDSGYSIEPSIMTAINDAGTAVGNGFPGCGDEQEALAMKIMGSDNSGLGFGYPNSLILNSVPLNTSFDLAPEGQGGSDQFLYRYWLWHQEHSEWILQQDWADLTLTINTPATAGEHCYRIDLADANNIGNQRKLIQRIRFDDSAPLENEVSNTSPTDDITADFISSETTTPEDLLIGQTHIVVLLLLSLLGIARRRADQKAALI